MRKRKTRRSNARQLNDDIAEAVESDARPRQKSVDPAKARTRTIQRAVNLLAAKPRSVGELRERLLEKEWATEEGVEAALVKLQEYGYLDDAQFAESFAASRVRGKPMGRSRIARDLGMKKIDRETADAALDKVFAETPEDELIDEAIARYAATRGAPADRAAQKRLFDYLMRRGFSYDLIAPRVRQTSKMKISDFMLPVSRASIV